MLIAKCGTDCSTCYCYEDQCNGCDSVKGAPFWVEHVGAEKCPIYKCSEDKGYNSCVDCSELPCELFYKQKDPSMSQEEHEKLFESSDELSQTIEVIVKSEIF